jgi:hypothetical protein
MREELFPAFVGQLERRLIGRRFGLSGDGFADEADGGLQAVVELCQFRVLGEGAADGGGLVGGEFAQQQRGEAGFQFLSGRFGRIRVHGRPPRKSEIRNPKSEGNPKLEI